MPYYANQCTLITITQQVRKVTRYETITVGQKRQVNMTAIFSVHYILFAVTKLINPHLLLDEWFRVLWSKSNHHQFSTLNLDYRSQILNNQTTGEHENANMQASLFFTHSILFISFILTFIASYLKTVPNADTKNEHRHYFINSLTLSMIFSAFYLYSINTLADAQLYSGSFILKCIHTLLVILLITGLNWSMSNVGCIGDSLALNFCVQFSKSLGVHYHFITYQLIAAFSLTFMSITLSEIYIATLPYYNINLSYTNGVIIMSLVALSVELTCFYMFTTSSQEELVEKKHLDEESSLNREKTATCWQPVKKTWLVLGEWSSEGVESKAIYSLSDNKSNLSMAAINMMQGNLGEISHTVDEDEVDLFYISMAATKPTQELPRLEKSCESATGCDRGDYFDASKFSLYDDFRLKVDNRFNKLKPVSNRTLHRTEHFVDKKNKNSCGKKRFNTFEILIISRDKKFMKHLAILTLLGCAYQANQLCFFSEYLNYLLLNSPADFRRGLVSLIYPNVESSDVLVSVDTSRVTNVLWMELVCLSFISQGVARIISLQYVNSLVKSLGARRVLLGLLITSSLISVQFFLNSLLIENSSMNLQNQVRAVIVIAHITLIQLQVGFVGSILDFLINELALEHSQQVANYRSTKRQTRLEVEEPTHCTVLGILNGFFYCIGGASLSALILLYEISFRIATSKHEFNSAFNVLYIVPILTLVALCFGLVLKRIRLIKAE